MTNHTPRPGSPLTTVEEQIVSLLAEGWTTRQLARALGAGPAAIDSRVRDMTRRVGARNRTHLVAKAIRRGWVAGAWGPVSAAEAAENRRRLAAALAAGPDARPQPNTP